jgi:ribosomal protein L24E
LFRTEITKEIALCFVSNESYKGNGNMYCFEKKLQIKQQRVLFRTEDTKEMATCFVSNRIYKGNGNMFCFEQKLQRT